MNRSKEMIELQFVVRDVEQASNADSEFRERIREEEVLQYRINTGGTWGAWIDVPYVEV